MGGEPKLIFSGTGEPSGFTTLATSAWDGKPEPIVRELLQNALDAAGEKPARVTFTIGSAPLADVPDIGTYREHFEEAAGERAGGVQGNEELRTIQRIRALLERKEAPVLFCRDHGHGLDAGRLDRVLREGDSGKDRAGAGSKGLGHLTAFAASDLRYVLYAGRSRDPGNGRMRDVASGHAILASRHDKSATARGGGGGWGGPSAVTGTCSARGSWDCSPATRSSPRAYRHCCRRNWTGSTTPAASSPFWVSTVSTAPTIPSARFSRRRRCISWLRSWIAG